MNAYLALISAAALSLAACSQQQETPAAAEPAAPATAEASAPAAPAAETTAEAAPEAAAAEASCSAVVNSDDAMKFDTSEINISKACKEFTLTLKHVGKLPKAAMGHNIVIAKSEDVDPVLKDGSSAGPDAGFIKAGDERIIAHTQMIGGGEETTVTVDTSKFSAGNKYEFFCSFPGHIGLMRGTVNLVD
ncbi:azurin [Neisseria weaveri]|uniref:Outer membrane protein n=1 Tax=Neisseria weaveri TaxID=28091 RepID=A0A3S5F9V0_9NEIS|nr:azurin [Neisseria weaveri]EGV34851.1 azurin [Neisseria weaveri LMG 5135]EGV37637.1 azurin [Neisseria weaveri ATCC 51223]VEJ51805.1 outer membrane protein [Neisseria weaveri]